MIQQESRYREFRFTDPSRRVDPDIRATVSQVRATMGRGKKPTVENIIVFGTIFSAPTPARIKKMEDHLRNAVSAGYLVAEGDAYCLTSEGMVLMEGSDIWSYGRSSRSRGRAFGRFLSDTRVAVGTKHKYS